MSSDVGEKENGTCRDEPQSDRYIVAEHCVGIGGWGRLRGSNRLPDRTADSVADCAPDFNADNTAPHTVTCPERSLP